jgi:tetratricopeptide (TPR) repeat protein
MRREKLYILVTIVITLWLQSGCSRTTVVEPSSRKILPLEISAALIESRELFQKRQNIANLRAAAAKLAKFRKADDRNYEIEWQYSRINYFLGLGSGDDEEKQSSFEKGRDAGHIAANMESERPEGHFWYGANLGELARINPVTVGITSVDDIRAEMNKVIELDPRYQNTAAFDVLAQVELGTLMFGGSAEKAAAILEKALTLEQDNAQIHLHLGQAYLAEKRNRDARAQLETVIRMPADPEFGPEQSVCVAEAQRMLKTKF